MLLIEKIHVRDLRLNGHRSICAYSVFKQPMEQGYIISDIVDGNSYRCYGLKLHLRQDNEGCMEISVARSAGFVLALLVVWAPVFLVVVTNIAKNIDGWRQPSMFLFVMPFVLCIFWNWSVRRMFRLYAGKHARMIAIDFFKNHIDKITE